MSVNNNKTSWVTPLIIPFIALVLSIGGSVFISGKTSGADTEKINRGEKDIEQLKSDYKADHDLIIQMDTKLTNIEELLKELKNKMNQRIK